MNVAKIFLLSSIIFVVFLAGCAKQTSVATAGVIIEKFVSQVPTVASNSPVEFTLIVKNAGEREARDVKAVLGGLIVSSSETDWRLGTDEDTLKTLASNLLGEDAQSGIKGEQGSTTWNLTAPIQTRDQTYQPTINLVYDYSTISTILIKAVNLNYFQSLPEDKHKLVDTGIVVSKTTKGPIEVSVKSDQAIISDSSTLPIEIEFKNVGGGRTFLGRGDETTPEGLYGVIKAVDKGKGLDKIFVELPDMNCNLKPYGETQNENKIYEVRLVQGKSGRILCNKVIGGVSTTQTFSMDIKADYRYLLEGKTAVKVSKTLYQPPIVDISLEESTVTIRHDHSRQSTDAILDLKIRNVGNQEISNTDIDISYVIQGITGGDRLLATDKSLRSFETMSSRVPIPSLPVSKDTVINYELKTVPERLPKLSETMPEETNIKNNMKSDTIKPDYDIAVTDLKGAIDDASKLSVKITATIRNNARNVDGIKIPFTVTVDEQTRDITCEVDGIKTSSIDIEKGKEKQIVCIYENPSKKLSMNIKASVAGSQLDINNGNDFNDKPNGEDKFRIVTNIALESTGTLNRIGNGAFEYTLTTQIKNVGTVAANIFAVRFVSVDEKQLFCHVTLDPIKLEGGQTSTPFSCKTPFLPLEKFTAKTLVSISMAEKDESQSFTVDSKIKLLILSDVGTTFQSWFIQPTVEDATSSAYQSFKFSKEFKLTRINVSLEQPTEVSNQLIIKIYEDNNGLPGQEIVSSPMQSLVVVDPNFKIKTINYANFFEFTGTGIELVGDRLYWVGLKCKSPCEGEKYAWKYRNEDIYSDGRGLATGFLKNNGDFGFHAYGIEK